MKNKETLEEAALKYAKKRYPMLSDLEYPIKDFIEGAKWQQERSYSEEEVILLLQKYRFDLSSYKTPNLGDTTKQWFEQFKKK